MAAPARTQTPRPSIVLPWRPLRFDENYAYLRDSVRHGWWQPLKYIPIGGWGSLSVGGEVRAEYERLDHPGFGALPTDLGGYELARVMLHADWRVGSQLRVFGQLASAQEAGAHRGSAGHRRRHARCAAGLRRVHPAHRPRSALGPGRSPGARFGRHPAVRDPRPRQRSALVRRRAGWLRGTAGCRGPVWGAAGACGPGPVRRPAGLDAATRGGCSAR